MIYAVALPDQAATVFDWLFAKVTKGFDWFFLGAANIFVIFCLLLIVTPYGSVRLGGTEARPITAISAGSRCCSPPAWASACCSSACPSR